MTQRNKKDLGVTTNKQNRRQPGGRSSDLLLIVSVFSVLGVRFTQMFQHPDGQDSEWYRDGQDRKHNHQHQVL